MADLPQPPSSGPLHGYLVELVAALENRLTRMEATQRERFSVSNLTAGVYSIDVDTADIADLRAVTGTLITVLARKGVI